MAFSPADIPNLYAWWRADDFTGSAWPDRSGHGRDLTIVGTPSQQTNVINGQSVARLNGTTDYFTQGSAADWKFLSNGSSFSIQVIYKLDADNPNKEQGIVDTGGLGTANVGFTMRHDDRAASSKDQRLEFYISRGTVGTYALEAVTRDLGVISNRWHWSEVNLSISNSLFGGRTDGRLGDTAVDDPPTGGYSSANPAATLHIGARTGGAAPFDGDIAEIIIYDTGLTNKQIRGLESYVVGRYALDIYRYDTRVTVFDDGSSYYAYGSFCIAANGDFIAVARKGSAPDSTDGVIVMKRSRDKGRTWGAEMTFSLDASYDYRNVTIQTLSSGRIIMAYAKYNGTTYGGYPQSAAFLTSDNNATTWSSEILPAAAFDAISTGGGPVLQLSNGDLLTPVWGRNAADSLTERSVKVLKSTDVGDTWSVLATLASGPTDTRDYTETGLYDLGGGNLGATVRVVDAAEPFYRATSSDSGATWGAKSLVISEVEGQPMPTFLPHGTLMDGGRMMDEAGEIGRFLSSSDDGLRWQKGEHIESPDDDGDRYAYMTTRVHPVSGLIYVLHFAASSTTVSSGYFLLPYLTTVLPSPLHVPFKERLADVRHVQR